MSSVARPAVELACELPAGYSLRAMHESDLHELHACIERNRDELGKWLRWAQEPNIESTRGHLLRGLSAEHDGHGLRRAIVSDGAVVGDVGLDVDRENNAGGIGYWLDRDHRGRGLVGAAVRALVLHGFASLALRRIEIRTDVENRASRAVAERLGFQLEGVLRQSYRVSESLYSDDAVYAMLASDPARQALAEGASVA
ncbi:MAG TPA: GNAT family protein [Solirubrobacteraceae bacterium]|nr:GNAT family protein [Solirubrobacteraceae bacterium]